MIEDPTVNEKNEAAPSEVSKLLTDKADDFRFHAAYLVYSNAWDTASTTEAKLKLNEIMTKLSAEPNDYETFYRQISQYRMRFGPESFSKRSFIETQRKRDWRKRDQRDRRNRRHGR